MRESKTSEKQELIIVKEIEAYWVLCQNFSIEKYIINKVFYRRDRSQVCWSFAAFILNLLHATLHTGGPRCLRSKAAQQYFAFSHAYFPDISKFKLFLWKILRAEAWETYWTPLWIHINNYITLVTATKIHALDGDVWSRINCPDIAMLVAKEIIILVLLWKFSVPFTCISKHSNQHVIV